MVDQDSKDDSVDNSVSVTRQKIILVGDQAVGKTSIIARIIDNPFVDNYEASIGIDFCSKIIKHKGSNVKLQIWDTAGQEKFKSLIPSYVRNAAIVLIVFDVNNPDSFEKVQSWVDFIKNLESCFLVLCGNKIDLERQVDRAKAEELAKKNEMPYFEMSAKTNEGIKTMFFNAIAELPVFGEEGDKATLAKELEKENEGDNKEGGMTEVDGSNRNKQPELNVEGGKKEKTEGKKKCSC